MFASTPSGCDRLWAAGLPKGARSSISALAGEIARGLYTLGWNGPVHIFHVAPRGALSRPAVRARGLSMLRQGIRRILPLSVRLALRRRVGILAGIETPGAPGDDPSAPADSVPDTSQAGEVAELDVLLTDDFPKSLVDIGAFDGVTISNSRPYTLRGWRAILVEPHPGLYAKLAAANEGMDNTTCVNMACSDRPGTLPLFLGSDGPNSAMSTLCTDDNPWFQTNRATDFVEVEVTTLTDLLASYEWPHDFAMLLVDAEGMDYEVLQGLDFNRFRPRIVVTEEYISNPEKHRNKYRLLMDRDYTFYKMVGCNTFWIANEWVDACLGLSAPRPDIASVSHSDQPARRDAEKAATPAPH